MNAASADFSRNESKPPRHRIAVAFVCVLLIAISAWILRAHLGWLLVRSPYVDSTRLVILSEGAAVKKMPNGVTADTFSVLQAQAKSFESMGEFELSNSRALLNVKSSGDAVAVSVSAISPLTFRVLAARLLLGRAFLPDEAQKAAPHVLILSQELWRSRFAGDPNTIGQEITLTENGQQGGYTVVGVMPASIEFPMPLTEKPDLWVPLQQPDGDLTEATDFGVVARLRTGVTLTQAQSDVDAIIIGWRGRIQERNAGVAVIPLNEAEDRAREVSHSR